MGIDCDGSSVTVSSGSDLRHLYLHQDVGVTTILTKALGLKLSFVQYARRRFLGWWPCVWYSRDGDGSAAVGARAGWLEAEITASVNRSNLGQALGFPGRQPVGGSSRVD